eukprot:TRINITY_DN22493_c0_g1_i2.p1 TRINITY_DN22493_c0_g1~~TRINITY_DN22493_c0_g1_i2.p1  ORF type:complete len:324 (-),score=42.46 TRINITY_DN22493_c0_g1_i2:54-1025(-)
MSLSRLPRHELGSVVLMVPSSGVGGAPSAKLLTRLCFSPSASSSGPFKKGFLYLHGFPDQSIDHRKEHPSYGSLSSRFPQKLADAVLKDSSDTLFAAFNFSGTPGSDEDFPFRNKTVKCEVEDARAVIAFLRGGPLPAPAPLTVVGLSTGAIIASLLRGCDPHLNIAVVASLLDTAKGLHFDFDETQLADFDEKGFCLKEFWLPVDSPSNPADAQIDEQIGEASGTTEGGQWRKHHLRLDATYYSDFLDLDISNVVSSHTSPLLVIHGGADKNVPSSNGEELFAAASEPKKMLVIPKGNHLLTGSKDFQKVARAVCELAQDSL